MGRTLAEKILLAHSDADDVAVGDVIMVRCDVVMANEISGSISFRSMDEMGVRRVFDPDKVVMVCDHFVPAKDERTAAMLKRLKEWSEEQGVHYYEQGRGIEHAVLVEEGFAVPGAVIVGADSHTCTHGALGAFGTGLGSTDIASALAFGDFWQAVPGTIRVEVVGEKRPFVTGKDVILDVLAQIGVAGGTGHVLEFAGSGAEALSIDERLAVCNMAVEAGSECGIFPADDKTAAYLEGRARTPWEAAASDPDAEFARTITIDLDRLEPLVAVPHLPGNVERMADLIGRKIDQVYIGNCGNGTITDLRQAAEILRGRRVHRNTRAILVPASREVYRQALAEGLIDLFVEAGLMISMPTCGACFGGSGGLLAAGESALTTTNRNFKGRMGSGDAGVHLANAWVAAAAAVAGEIVDPAELA